MKNAIVFGLALLSCIGNAEPIFVFDIVYTDDTFVIESAGAVPGTPFLLPHEEFIGKTVEVGFEKFGQENVDKTMNCIKQMFTNENAELCSFAYAVKNPQTSKMENFEARFTKPKIRKNLNAPREISIFISTIQSDTSLNVVHEQ